MPRPVESAARSRWSGQFHLDAGRAAYAGPTFVTGMHAHHAVQIVVGLDGPIRVRTTATAPWRAHAAATIPAEHPHAIDGGGHAAVFVYLDPEWCPDLGRGPRVSTLPDRLIDAIRRALERRGLRAALDEVARAVGHASLPSSALDVRIAEALRVLRDDPLASPPSTAMARFVGLSADRFRHVWQEQVGLAYRRYLLWRRLQVAVSGVAHGRSVTDAAHDAGFSDGAHLTRTFRRMFGLNPSAFLTTNDRETAPRIAGDTRAGSRGVR